MKKPTLLISMLVALPLFLYSQLEIEEASRLYTYQTVEEHNDLSKDDLYAKVLEWVALNYNSANDVIQLKDQEQGKIIVKGSFNSSMYGKQGQIKHTIRFDFKDGKYRLTCNGLSYYSKGSGELAFEKKGIAGKKKLLINTESKIKSLIVRVNNFIVGGSEDEDW